MCGSARMVESSSPLATRVALSSYTMTNHYRLAGLKHTALASAEEERRIFFMMRSFCSIAATSLSLPTLDDLWMHMPPGEYYVASNHVAHRGKAEMFKGRTVTSTLTLLRSFLHDACYCDDLRPMLISPCFDGQPERVALIDSDQIHVYFQNTH